MSLYLRHLLWTTLCPGTVTIVLPWLLFSSHMSVSRPLALPEIAGVAFIATGAYILISCIVMFGKFGKGTLSPFDPARHLVIEGLYRYVRNPMYVGVFMILIGEWFFFSHWLFLAYAGVVFLIINGFVIFYEEPFLRNEFGKEYDHYRKHVHRWLPGKKYLSGEFNRKDH